MPHKDPEALREYRRAYYEANRGDRKRRVLLSDDERREKQRERNRNYRQANLERLREYSRIKGKENRERHRGYERAYAERNRDKRNEYGRSRYRENREHVLERCRAYRDANRDYRARQLADKMKKLAVAIPAPRSNEKWTPAEDAIAARSDLTIVECCYMLGRSYSSVHTRRSRMRKKAAA
jgi:hypothetical protein